MSKILMKNDEPYFIDSIYDLNQVVGDDTYNFILELLEDEKEEQCSSCNHCDPDDVDDYEEEYEICKSMLEDAKDLFEDVITTATIEDNVRKNIVKMIENIKWELR